MNDSKRLYFIPLIARALAQEDQTQALDMAFEEIQNQGQKQEYNEGFRQFQEFVKTALSKAAASPELKANLIKEALYHLIYDLVTDTFEGDSNQKEMLIEALQRNAEWRAEYERIKKEAQDLGAPKIRLKIELLRDSTVIGTMAVEDKATSFSSIIPGRYTVRLSNGRILWEGALTREDLIWTYAFPTQDLAMAAKTEPFKQPPTKKLPLLADEVVMQVFAGLESGAIRISRAHEGS